MNRFVDYRIVTSLDICSGETVDDCDLATRLSVLTTDEAMFSIMSVRDEMKICGDIWRKCSKQCRPTPVNLNDMSLIDWKTVLIYFM